MGEVRFLDIQQVLTELLEVFAGVGHTGVESPNNLVEVLPFVRVLRIGGPSDLVNDYPRVEIDVFHGTYRDAERMAQDIHQYVIGGGLRAGAAVIDRTGVDRAPLEQPWVTPGVRRFQAAYQFVTRRHISS